MASRNGSQALAEGQRPGGGGRRPAVPPTDPAPESVVTGPPSLAAFGGESVVTPLAGFAPSGSVVTSTGRLAGFAGNRRPRAAAVRRRLPLNMWRSSRDE